MASDARVRYTKMVIKEQFATLLATTPLNKVTVKEICVRAEINRATFYRYYKDPYDLLEKIEQEFLEDMFRELADSVSTGTKKVLILIMEKMKENISLYQALFSENGDKQFIEKLFTHCYKEHAVNLHERFQNLSFQKQEFLFYFIAQGCSGILTQWLTNGMATPIEEVADFAEKLISNAIDGLQG